MNPTWLRLLCAGALALTSLLAHAQYSWLDDKGIRVFSDRPPPAGTPPSRILKTPRGLEPHAAQAEPASSTAAAPAPAPAAADKAKAPTLADREADFRKRAEQREADEKKAAHDAANKLAKAENCRYAREIERSLTSGVRMNRVNEKGEKVFLTDDERALRLEHARKGLKDCG